MPTEIIRDVGRSGLYDYTTIQDWETAYAALNPVTGDEIYVCRLHMSDDQPFEIRSSELFTLNNSNTTKVNHREIRPAVGQEYNPANGKGCRIRLIIDTNVSNDALFDIREVGFVLKGGIRFEVVLEQDITTTQSALAFRSDGGVLDALEFRYISSEWTQSSGTLTAIQLTDVLVTAADDINVSNCLITNPESPTEGFNFGITAVTGQSNVAIYNCAVVGMRGSSNRGIKAQGSSHYVINCVSVDNDSGGLDLQGSTSSTLFQGNATSDSTADDYSLSPFYGITGVSASQCFLNAWGGDLRLKFGSPLLNAGRIPSTEAPFPSSVTVITTDFEGSTRILSWEIGPFDGYETYATGVPTIVETQIGTGLYDHPEQWLRDKRGNLPLLNGIYIGKLEKRTGNLPYRFDNEIEFPEMLPRWTKSADAGIPTSTNGPWNFFGETAALWRLPSVGSPTVAGIWRVDAGSMAASGDWNIAHFLIEEDTYSSFALAIHNATDATTDLAIFDFVGGVPTFDSGASSADIEVKVWERDSGTYSVVIAYQSVAGDVGDDREVLIYNVKPAATPTGGFATIAGFVRCVSRDTKDLDLPYCRGTNGRLRWDQSYTDSDSYRKLVADEPFDFPTMSGPWMQHDNDFSCVELIEEFAFFGGGIFIDVETTADVERRGVGIFNSRIEVNGVGVRCDGGANSNPVDGIKLHHNAHLSYVFNCIIIGSNNANGMRRGLGSGSATLCDVANCVAYQVTGGTDGTGFLKASSATTMFRNCIAVECDVDYAVAEANQEHNASSDATALGPGALTSQTAVGLFNDAVGLDFRLNVTSPGINAGVDISFFLDNDFIGTPRSAPWDLGAYEGFVIPPQRPKVPLAAGMRLCIVWTIERFDGTILRFTNNNEPILWKGQIYTPAGGFDSSVRRAQLGMKEQSVEFIGVISDEYITDEDLHAGRYRNAKVTEELIDWKYPFADPRHTDIWRVLRTSFSGENWDADVVGIGYILSTDVGSNNTLTCDFILGEPSTCGADIFADTLVSVAVTQVDDERRTFRASSISGSYADDYFNFGVFQWLTGDNVGLKSVCKDYTLTDRIIKLQTRMPKAIQIGDKFYLEPGCDRLASTCNDKFNNLLRYGGEKFLPGTDKSLQTPTQ